MRAATVIPFLLRSLLATVAAAHVIQHSEAMLLSSLRAADHAASRASNANIAKAFGSRFQKLGVEPAELLEALRAMEPAELLEALNMMRASGDMPELTRLLGLTAEEESSPPRALPELPLLSWLCSFSYELLILVPMLVCLPFDAYLLATERRAAQAETEARRAEAPGLRERQEALRSAESVAWACAPFALWPAGSHPERLSPLPLGPGGAVVGRGPAAAPAAARAAPAAVPGPGPDGAPGPVPGAPPAATAAVAGASAPAVAPAGSEAPPSLAPGPAPADNEGGGALAEYAERRGLLPTEACDRLVGEVHCAVTCDGDTGSLAVEDLGGGVWLNGARVRDRAPLSIGDTLSLRLCASPYIDLGYRVEARPALPAHLADPPTEQPEGQEVLELARLPEGTKGVPSNGGRK